MLTSNVVITNQTHLAEIKAKIIQAGPAKLQVLSDFDKTLTKCFVRGEKIASLISILRDQYYLTPDYAAKAQALYAKYHPIEVDSSIPLTEKIRLMQEWWSVHYELLIKSGLNIKDIENIVASKKVELRAGAPEFFDLLNEQQIPLVILSAAGVGIDAISLYLEQAGKLLPNIHIASNQLLWGEAGQFIGVKSPIVHSFNKNYETVRNFAFYDTVKDRKNILFLGDNVNDLQMLNGFDYDQVIKVGFLNDQIEEKFPEYQEAFDVVILNDGPLDYVNSLIKELVTS